MKPLARLLCFVFILQLHMWMYFYLIARLAPSSVNNEDVPAEEESAKMLELSESSNGPDRDAPSVDGKAAKSSRRAYAADKRMENSIHESQRQADRIREAHLKKNRFQLLQEGGLPDSGANEPNGVFFSLAFSGEETHQKNAGTDPVEAVPVADEQARFGSLIKSRYENGVDILASSRMKFHEFGR